MAKRPASKRPRAPARKSGVLLYQLAPVGCHDASEGEVAKALFALAKAGGFTIGQGSGYEPIKDKYYLIAKSSEGKAQDIQIEGAVVAELIKFTRQLNGGRMWTMRERMERRRAG